MKVLTLSVYSTGHGAYERQRRMAQALLRAGHEVIWAAPGLDHANGETFLRVRAGSLFPGPPGWIHAVLRSFRAERERLADVDLVYVVNEYDALACTLSGSLAGKPIVFFQRGDTVEVERFHARHATSLPRRMKSRLVAAWYPFLQRFLMRRLRGVVVQAPFLADLLKQRNPVMPPVALLPNDTRIGWHAAPVAPGEEEALLRVRHSADFLVGLVAQVFWHGKGFDVFLDALALVKDVKGLKAVIVGYGPDEQRIEESIAARGLAETVIWLGRWSAAHTLMDRLDLLVVPTVFTDACPNVVLEGLKSEIALLASDIPAHREQLRHEAMLVPAGDASALASRIRDLATDARALEHNRALARERRQALAFDWDGRVVALMTDFAEVPCRAREVA